jgi:hypothetical protein
MAIAARDLSARKYASEVGLEEGASEALQGWAHLATGVFVAGQEAAFQASVPFEDLPCGHAEGDHVARPIEPVTETRKEVTMTIGLETHDEAGRRGPHGDEHPLEGSSEEVDASIGEACREQGHDFPVLGIAVAKRKPDGIPLDSGAIIEARIEVLERLP